jgi:glycosyltransferase involved in cell wall biosynthesis
MPDLSVVAPTYRRPDLVDALLGSLETQDLPSDRFEVLVVDDGSGDGTGEALERWRRRLPNLRTFTQPSNRGPAAARNRGWQAADAPVVLFLDDDIIATPDLVRTHLELHAAADDPRLGFLGRVDWAPSVRITPFMRWLDASGLQFAFDTWLRPGPVDPPFAAFYTANLSMHRALLEEAGGFDERFPYPAYEDMELAWRLTERGFRMHHRPEALAFHNRQIDLATYRRRMAMVGESAELFAALQPEFPVEHGGAERGAVRRRTRWWLRVRSPLARLLGDEALLGRWYAAEIARAYQAGRSAGVARLAARVGADPS